jgi:hypothetical protein
MKLYAPENEDPRHNENQALGAIDMERMLTLLDENDLRIIRGVLDGFTPEEMGSSQHAPQIIAHTLASEAGLLWRCDVCGEKPATEFGWNSPHRCLEHENPNHRYKRPGIERHRRAVEAGEEWECATCGQSKPALAFLFDRASCHECSKAIAAASVSRLQEWKRLKADGGDWPCTHCGEDAPADKYKRATSPCPACIATREDAEAQRRAEKERRRAEREQQRAEQRKARAPHHNAKLTPEDVVAIREEYAAGGVLYWELAVEYGVNESNIGRIVRRERWAHIP